MSTAVAKKQESQFELALTDKSMSDYLAKVIGEKKEQFVSNMIALVNSNTNLANVPPQELINAGLQATAMDLPLEKSLGCVYVIPYKGHAQFQVGKDGYIQLAMRTEKYKTINVCTIYSVRELQNKAFLHGEPFAIVQVKTNRITNNLTKPIGYCATFVTVWGFEKSQFVTTDEMQKFCSRYSESYKNDKYGKSLWNTDFDIMAEKTVLKNLLKHFGIKTTEINKAIVSDQAVIKDFDSQEYDYIDNPSEVQDVQAEVVSSASPQQKPQVQQPSTDEVNNFNTFISKKDFVNAATYVAELAKKYPKLDFSAYYKTINDGKEMQDAIAEMGKMKDAFTAEELAKIKNIWKIDWRKAIADMKAEYEAKLKQQTSASDEPPF